MTNDISTLIPVRDHDGQQVASGRDLHSYLGVGRDYTTWFKQMIAYGFTEGEDFTPVRVESSGGRPGLDHAVTIDTAKEIGMLQRTEKGKELRQYFIEVEKRFREQSNIVALPSRAALAQMVLDAEKEIEAAKMQAELDAPKVRYHERFVAEMDDVQTIDMFATDWGTTGPKVRELLRTKGVAVRRILGRRWSKSKQRMVDVPEWRPRQGTRYSEWFVVRPQHDAPRHHNGQVRTTMYLLRFHAEDLAQKLGLTEPAMFDGSDAA